MSGERTVRFAGVVVRAVARDPALAWHLDWHVDQLPAATGPAALTIELGARVRAPCDRQPTHVDHPIRRWDDGDVLWLRHDDGAAGRVDDRRLVVDASGIPASDWRPTRQLLFSAWSWWLARRGTPLLHGACVGRHGEALLVLGGTGAGKSTVAIAASVAGWQVMGDDLVAVTTDDQGPVVEALPKRMMVAPELAARVGPTGAFPLAGDARGRLVMPPGTLATGTRRLRGVVRVGHDTGPGRTAPLAHETTLAEVLYASLEAERPAVLSGLLGPLAAAAGTGGHALRHAADRDHRLDRAAALLEEIWSAAARPG